MPNSKYTYDDFTHAASASGFMSDFDEDDLRNARVNPDAAMTLLSYKKDYANAMRSGNDSAAYLAQDGINRIKAGYAPATANDKAAIAPSVGKVSAGSFGGSMPSVPVNTSSSAPSATGSGSFGMKDVARLIRSNAGYDVGDVSGYDVNADGGVNQKDTAYMLRRLAGYDDTQAQTMAKDDAAIKPADYKTEYSRLLGEYLGGGVNVEGSDLWKNLSKTYAREGARAQESVIDQFAAANGGQVSSYAQSAAAQQRNYYMSQLMDKYPEVYSQLRGEQADKLSALMSAMELQRNDAVLAAQYGDMEALRSLGIDPSRYLEEEEYQKRAQEALYAAQYGDYTLLDTLFGSNTEGAKERAERIAALQAALGYGDASGFDAEFGTSVGDVLADEKAYERGQAELDKAYTLAQLGMYDELAALTGRTVDEIKSAIAMSSYSQSSSSGSSSTDDIPSEINAAAKELNGNNYALHTKLSELLEKGSITEEQADYLYTLYAQKYTTRDIAIEYGADPSSTWSERTYNTVKKNSEAKGVDLPYLGDRYEEYLEYMVAKGNGYIS